MTLPPDPPPPDPRGRPSQSRPADAVLDAGSEAERAAGWPARWPKLLRAALFGLSTVGICVALGLWVAGYPRLAARVLAGDVLLILIILLAL